MGFKTKTALAVLALMGGASAMAQVTFNAGLVSDYRFRGIEQTAGAPSLQAGVDYAHSSGFYAGAFFADNIKWIKEFNGASQGGYEIDVYGGFKGDLSKSAGLGYDVGVITYNYPGNDSGAVGTPGTRAAWGANPGAYTRADTIEMYAGLTYKMVGFKMYQSTGDFLGNADTTASRYFDLNATFDLGNGFSLTPHWGYQTIPSNAKSNPRNDANYTDYSLTVAKDLGKGFVVSLSAISTDAKRGFYTTSSASSNANRYLGKDTVVLGVKYNF